VLWNREAFVDIREDLGMFLHVDLEVLKGKDRQVGKILVEMDILKGILTDIKIEWRGHMNIEILD